MMDPITLIESALAAGATALARGRVNQAGQDAYQQLKGRIQRKFAGNSDAQWLLAEHEETPYVWEIPLKYELTEADADEDEEIIEAAEKVMRLIKPQKAAKVKHNTPIRRHVQGFVQGDHATVTISFGGKVR